MKYIVFSLIFSCFSIFANAQAETVSYKETVKSFQDSFNQESYESIFALFSKEMKEYLPLPNTISFFEEFRAQAGKIKDTEFEGYEKSNTASYKTNLDNGIFTLQLSLNEKGEIAGFLIKPYEAKADETKKVSNKMFFENSEITKEQSKIIFNKIKDYPDQTQLAFAIINNGKVSYYGTKRDENSIVEVNNSKKIFEIGSITKVFTATLLAELIINGKVEPEEPINGYLGFEINKGQKITFLTLANHSSGLPQLPTNLNFFLVDPKNPYADYDDKKLERYLNESLELKDPENIKYEYSNLGAGLLAYVLAEIENSNFEDMLQKKIFSKYEMRNSTTERDKINGELVIGLDSEGKATSNWDLSSLKGAGAILSTVEDLSKFAMAQFSSDNKALSMTQKSTISISDKMDVGLGWHLLKDKNYIWHNGGTGGYSSSMVLDVTNKNGIIILSNVSTFHPKNNQIDQLSFELMKSMN